VIDMQNRAVPMTPEMQLRQAWDDFGRVLDDLLGRNREFASELAKAHERERALIERLTAMEGTLASYQSTLEQMGGLLSQATDRARAIEQDAVVELARIRAEAQEQAVDRGRFATLLADKRDALAALETSLVGEGSTTSAAQTEGPPTFADLVAQMSE